jgi:type IV pilus assembly protein PilB
VRKELARRDRGAPRVDLEQYEVDPEVLPLLDRDQCSRLLVLPVSRAGSTLILAMAEPTDVGAKDEVKFLTGFDVEPLYAPKEAIEAAIARQYERLDAIQ